MKLQRVMAVVAICAVAAGCASKAKDIEGSYVSSVLYEKLSCAELRQEAQSVSARALEASGNQDKKAGQDAAAVTVGLVLFWPALFFTKGDGAAAGEVARLKGEMMAIEQASRRNNCGIVFQKTPAKVVNK